MFKNRSIAGFIATVLAVAYGVYLITYFGGVNANKSGDAEAAGAAIATLLVVPQMILVWIGAIFGLLGFFLRKTGFLLTAAILYAAGGLFFLLYIMFLIPSIVLGFVGYANQKKINKR